MVFGGKWPSKLKVMTHISRQVELTYYWSEYVNIDLFEKFAS